LGHKTESVNLRPPFARDRGRPLCWGVVSGPCPPGGVRTSQRGGTVRRPFHNEAPPVGARSRTTPRRRRGVGSTTREGWNGPEAIPKRVGEGLCPPRCREYTDGSRRQHRWLGHSTTRSRAFCSESLVRRFGG